MEGEDKKVVAGDFSEKRKREAKRKEWSQQLKKIFKEVFVDGRDEKFIELVYEGKDFLLEGLLEVFITTGTGYPWKEVDRFRNEFRAWLEKAWIEGEEPEWGRKLNAWKRTIMENFGHLINRFYNDVVLTSEQPASDVGGKVHDISKGPRTADDK